MNPEKLIKYSLPFFVFAIISRSIEELSFFYYAVPVLCVFFIGYYLVDVKSQKPEVKGQKHKIENDYKESDIHHPTSNIQSPTLLFLIPGVWFLLTALWSSYPLISAERALYFILISIGCISAAMLWIKYSVKGILDFILPVNILIVLLCLFSLITNIPADSWTGGNGKGFMGFFGQQNQLASMVLFTLPSVFVKLKQQVSSEQLIVNSNVTKLKPLITTNYLLLTCYSLLLVSNLLLLILTYSRA